MKTNIVISAVRVNGYWYLRVKYDENDCCVRYQQSTGLKIDQSSRQVEQARRRVLAELYEINRMDEQCEKWDISPELRYQPVSKWLKRWLDDCRESKAPLCAIPLLFVTPASSLTRRDWHYAAFLLWQWRNTAMQCSRMAIQRARYRCTLNYCRPRLPPPAAADSIAAIQSVACSCRMWNAIFRVRTLPQSSKSCWRN